MKNVNCWRNSFLKKAAKKWENSISICSCLDSCFFFNSHIDKFIYLFLCWFVNLILRNKKWFVKISSIKKNNCWIASMKCFAHKFEYFKWEVLKSNPKKQKTWWNNLIFFFQLQFLTKFSKKWWNLFLIHKINVFCWIKTFFCK